MKDKRISINEIAISDADALFTLMSSNSSRFLRFFPKTLKQNSTVEDSKIFILKKRKEQEQKEEYTFLLKEHTTNQIIGLLILKEINWITKQGELAYCIDHSFEGKGLMTRAVQYLSAYSFQKLALRTLQIIVHNSNFGSIRVAEKSNYIWQRTLKNTFTPPNEKTLDMELYELKNET
jgi:ribosomal-protein-alanine N-acetyltransferase